MLFLRAATGIAGALMLGAACAAPATHALHERQSPQWGQSWTKKERVPADAVLPMRIGLKQSNLEYGHEKLMDMVNPRSPNFGNHMSAQEVIQYFAPAESSVEVVVEWLVSAGFASDRVSQSVNKQWIQLDATASEAEALLSTEYYIYENVQTGTLNIACNEYHVPESIQSHIDYITPGIRLRENPGSVAKLNRRHEAEKLQKRGIQAQNTGLIPIVDQASPNADTLPPLNSSVCNVYVTDQCIRNQYRIPKGDKAAPGNELGIFESLNDHYSKNDLDVFWSTLYPAIPNGTYPIEKLIDGAIGASPTVAEAGIESDLDFQSAWPLIWPQKTVLFQTDDQYYEINQTDQKTPYLGFWNTFFDALDGSYCTYSAYGETGNCDTPECLDPSYPNPNPGGYKGQLQCGVYEPTNVISISYGGGEADLPDYYIKRQCDEVMKLGLQGITVVISSGDYGVASYPGDFGLENGCAGPDATIFYPATAASCPYVLAVGGTQFDKPTKPGPACKLDEVATARFPSGGGFSNYFPTADYQKDAVATYFNTVTLNFTGYTDAGVNFSTVGDGVYKIGGRGYPDVAAIGDRFVVRGGGQWGRVGGTSLSAPVWAALLTRVNEERLAVGKSTVGFVNPIFYAHPEIFTDITVGSNPGCHSTGFVAAKGWDPVTGLGSPIYPKLLSLLLSLP